MINYDDLQKRLQRGSTQIHEANNLIAEAYGVIGSLVSANEQFKAVAFDQEAGRQVMEGEIARLKTENDALRARLSKPDPILIQCLDSAVAEMDQLEKDAARWRFVRSPIGTESPLAIWREGRMPLFSGLADAAVDDAMAEAAQS